MQGNLGEAIKIKKATLKLLIEKGILPQRLLSKYTHKVCIIIITLISRRPFLLLLVNEQVTHGLVCTFDVQESIESIE